MTGTRSRQAQTTPENDRERVLADLLERTSRTFALAIPLLPSPLDGQVTTAYLLFRIADTFEDATVFWTRERRLEALAEFDRLLSEPTVDSAERLADRWLTEAPTEHQGYVDLLRHTPTVIADLISMPERVQAVMVRHTRRTTTGMAGFVEKGGAERSAVLADLSDLKRYCYVVAGIVGEMLTELFLLQSGALAKVDAALRDRAAAFGEGLQLVNILKDSADDRLEGRAYLPSTVDRSDVFELARHDLTRAREYCLLLQQAGAAHGITAFAASPVALAGAALSKVESEGPGAKLTRAQVFALHGRVRAALVAGRPVFDSGG